MAARLRWLSEEEEERARGLRDEIRNAEQKLYQMKERRADLLALARRIGDEALTLQESRQPKYEEVERLHQEYRELGFQLQSLRNERDKARARVEELLGEIREKRSLARDRTPRIRPERISQEIAQLEKRQQTSVMTVKEENALIAHIRELRGQLTEAQKSEAAWKMEDQTQQGVKDELQRARQQAEELQQKFEALRQHREQVMVQVKERLVEVGHLVGEIRARGKARAETLEKVDALSNEIRELERSVMGKINESREIQYEARRAIEMQNRSVRPGSPQEEELRRRSAEQNLRALFQKGKIEL